MEFRESSQFGVIYANLRRFLQLYSLQKLKIDEKLSQLENNLNLKIEEFKEYTLFISHTAENMNQVTKKKTEQEHQVSDFIDKIQNIIGEIEKLNNEVIIQKNAIHENSASTEQMISTY
jgi:hypothetical protein